MDCKQSTGRETRVEESNGRKNVINNKTLINDNGNNIVMELNVEIRFAANEISRIS